MLVDVISSAAKLMTGAKMAVVAKNRNNRFMSPPVSNLLVIECEVGGQPSLTRCLTEKKKRQTTGGARAWQGLQSVEAMKGEFSS